VHRSTLDGALDASRGERVLFEAIRIARKRSLRNNDLDARTASILSQLWSSSKLFRYNDGTIDGLRLLLRGRLVSEYASD
jgi:hypothetical protein